MCVCVCVDGTDHRITAASVLLSRRKRGKPDVDETERRSDRTRERGDERRRERGDERRGVDRESQLCMTGFGKERGCVCVCVCGARACVLCV